MPEINYQSVKSHIQERRGGSFDPVYLIFGEPYLYEQVTRTLVNAVIPDASRQKHGWEVISQQEEGSLSDVIERMSTYSFFSGKKIMELRDATVFVTAHNHGQLMAKVLQLYENNDFEKAAKKFLHLLSRLQVDLSDLPETLSPSELARNLQLTEAEGEDTAAITTLKKIIAHCRDRQMTVPAAADDADLLKNAIEKGFPKNNILVITTDTADKRKALYKTIKKHGTVIDCAIPRGTRKADVDAQRAFLQQLLQRLLHPHGKQMDMAAFDRVFQLTGFDVRAFCANIEKLVDYARDRDRICLEDVQAVLVKTRIDPIYELTGALADRNAVKTLEYMRSLLDNGFHYLQILTAMVNQIRKLLLIRDFQQSPSGLAWSPGLPYDQFRQTLIPLIVAHDQAIGESFRRHEMALKGQGEGDASGKKGKKPAATDLVIAKNPKNPYPVFLQFRQAGKFSRNALMAAVEQLAAADLQLKRSGRDPAGVLEAVIFAICRPPAGVRRQNIEVRRQKSGVRIQKIEGRSQESEVRISK